MEITLKNYEIIDIIYALKDILKLDELPTTFNWNLIKNLTKFEASYKNYTECQKVIIQKYALTDDNGNIKVYENDATDGSHKKGDIMFAPKNEKEHIKEQNELLNCEDTISIHKIKLADLPNQMGKGELLQRIRLIIDDEN